MDRALQASTDLDHGDEHARDASCGQAPTSVSPLLVAAVRHGLYEPPFIVDDTREPRDATFVADTV